MRKKFLSDFFFIQIINLLIKPVWILIIDRKVQNILPAEEYGTYFGLTGFSLLFMILLDLGITNYNNREVAIDKAFYKKNFWSIIGTKSILSIVFFVLASAIGYFIGFNRLDFMIFGLLALNQCLLSFNTYLRSNISAIHQFKADGFLSVIDRLFVIISLGVILWTSFSSIKIDLFVFIISQTIGLALTFFLALLANLNYLGKAEFSFHRNTVVELVKKSLPYAFIIALMTLYTRLDSVLIMQLLPSGRSEAGTYAMSYRLLDAAAIIGTLLAGQLLPIFASNLVNKARLNSIVKWSALLVFIPSILATFTCSLFGAEIMQLLYPEKYTLASGVVFSILIWCIPGMVLVNIFGTLLTSAGKVKRINQLALVACLFNIMGNVLFLPLYGLKAAALTAVFTQVFFGFMCFQSSRMIYK